VVQEGLTNARRHAPGEPVRLVVRRGPGSLHVGLANRVDGGPIVPGHGLSGLGQRVELEGGTLQASVVDGEVRLEADFGWAA
jgi:signal transduction histidine kinase